MINIIITVLGGVVLILGLVSKALEKSPVPVTLLALIAGVILGPEVFGVIDPGSLGNRSSILESAARLTMAIGLFSVALRIPKDYPKKNWRQMLTLIGLSMILMWVISSLLVFLIIGVPFWLAVLIGGIVTPTDPVASSPIVTGPVAEKNLPDRIRHAISFESGANDGLSYIFVFLSYLLIKKPADEAISYWFIHTILWEVVAAASMGAILGYVAAILLKKAESLDIIQEDWRLVYTAALAFIAAGAGKLIHSDEVLVIFAAGIAFVQVIDSEERGIESHGQEAMNKFFSIPIFTLLGTAIPWQGWFNLGIKGLLLVVAVILFRRPPVLLLLKPLLPFLKDKKDALFVGWFGPVAVAAIYYAALFEHKLSNPLIWDVVSLIICSSVVVHGISSTPLTKLYGSKSRTDE